jgi:hypothetical protein
MTETSDVTPMRSYGCTFGCGNAYDVIVIMVADGTTEFLCFPCYVKLASDLVEAMTNPDAPNVQEAVKWASANPSEIAPGPNGKARGKNAPATTDDPDLIEAFDDVITVDDLPPEFR